MKITDRYVLKEHLGPLVFALSALTSLLLLNYIAKRFGALVGKGLPWRVIGEFFVLSIPFTVAMTIPMAVLVSTLYAFSRMAAENEITAYKASGVSVRRLMAPVLIAAVVLAAGMIYFNDQILPRANHRLAVLQSDILRKKPTFALREQVTNRVTERLWLRAGHIEPVSGGMREVVIYDFSDPERPRTVYADSGTLALTADEKDLALELFDGVIQEFPQQGLVGARSGGGTAGEGAPGSFQRTYFERDRVLVRDVGNQLQRTDQAGDQIKSDREQSICELQRNYVRYAREYHASHTELVDLAARLAEDGRDVDVPKKRRTYERNGLGALYCSFVESVSVQTAFAATPGSPSAGPAQDPAVAQDVEQDVAQEIVPGSPDSVVFGPAIASPDAAPPAVVEEPEFERDLAQRDTRVSDVLMDAARMRVSNNLEAANRYDVEIQKKFALAVACVVFVLLGAPIALRFPRGGVGLVIGVSLGVFGLYYVGLIAGETMADKGYLPPWAAMWAANIVFTAAGLVLLARVGKEGGTARGGDLGELWESLRGRFARVGRRVGVPLERRRRSVS